MKEKKIGCWFWRASLEKMERFKGGLSEMKNSKSNQHVLTAYHRNSSRQPKELSSNKLNDTESLKEDICQQETQEAEARHNS